MEPTPDPTPPTRREDLAQQEAERAAGVAWWREHVAAQRTTVRVEAELDLTLAWTHSHGDDGSFEASLGAGQGASLARRPRSDAPWDLRWHGDPPAHRWSTPRWDWAFRVHDLRFTEDLRITEAAYAAVEESFPDR